MRVVSITMRYFIVLFIFVNTVAGAAETGVTRQLLARYVSNKLGLKQNAQKEAELRKDVDGTFTEIRKLRQARKATKEQSSCEICTDTAEEFCNRPALHPEFCRDGECKLALEPKKDVCYRIYRNDPCYKTLTPAARAKVNTCWQVDNHLTVKELEIEIDSLKKQLDDVIGEKYDLMKYELALEEECPRCSKARVPAHFIEEETDSHADDEPVEQ